PRDEPIFIRGHPKNPGRLISRRCLEALLPLPVLRERAGVRADVDPPEPASTSGRLDLAAKIANATNPLTPRVYVNRIWHHLFAQGIVPSTDNFGALGEKPSHPELLDYLATQFIKNNWSTKHLIRQLA